MTDALWSGQKPLRSTTFGVAWDGAALVFDVRYEETNMCSFRASEQVWAGDSVMSLLAPPGHSDPS